MILYYNPANVFKIYKMTQRLCKTLSKDNNELFTFWINSLLTFEKCENNLTPPKKKFYPAIFFKVWYRVFGQIITFD